MSKSSKDLAHEINEVVGEFMSSPENVIDQTDRMRESDILKKYAGGIMAGVETIMGEDWNADSSEVRVAMALIGHLLEAYLAEEGGAGDKYDPDWKPF